MLLGPRLRRLHAVAPLVTVADEERHTPQWVVAAAVDYTLSRKGSASKRERPQPRRGCHEASSV